MSRNCSRQLLSLLSLLCFAGFLGCAGTKDATIQTDGDPGFDRSIRLDRAGSPDSAYSRWGGYRDGLDDYEGEGEAVSEIVPRFRDPLEERLVQSDCYWLSSPASNRVDDSGSPLAKDVVNLTWEVTWKLSEDWWEQSRFGFCRFRDPNTGAGLALRCERDPAAPAPKDPIELEMAIDQEWWLRPDYPCETAFELGQDLDLRRADLRAIQGSAIDQGALCPGPFDPERTVPFPGVAGSIPLEDDPIGQLPLCADRIRFTPEKDTTLEVAFRDSSRRLEPNLMVVDGARTLRRRLEVADPGEPPGLRWFTPFERTGDSTRARWHENFSPNLKVASAAVYHLVDGRETAPRTATLELQLPRSRAGDDRWICQGAPAGDRFAFDLGSCLCDGPGDCGDEQGSSLSVTPTYVHGRFLRVAIPDLAPLIWRIHGADEALESYLELSLVSVPEKAGVLVDAAVTDLGEVLTGDTAHGWLEVRNPSSVGITVDQLFVDGADAADFAAMAVETVASPMPLEISDDGSGYRVGSLPTAYDTPLDLLRFDTTFGAQALRISPSTSFGNLELYGEAVSEALSEAFGVPVLDSATPQFDIGAASAELPLRFPVYFGRETPFVLGPGERVRVRVAATPSSYREVRAELVLETYPVHDPTQVSTPRGLLVAEGVTGPILDHLPAQLQIPALGTRGVLIENRGQTAAERQSISISGPDAASFRVTSAHDVLQRLGPGEAESFYIRYEPAGALPAFGQLTHARLEVATSGGRIDIPITGHSSLAFPERVLLTRGSRLQARIQITNLADEAIALGQESFTGPDAGLFQMIAGGSGFVLRSGDSRTLVVGHTSNCRPPLPISGLRSARLEIPSDVGTVVVELEAPVCP